MPQAQEQIFVAAPVQTGARQIISSPFQFYCDGTETLTLLVVSSLDTTVSLVFRWLNADGTIQVFRRDFSVIGDRGLHLLPIKLDRGFLLNLQLRNFHATAQIGQTYASVWIRRGEFPTGPDMGVLVSGYVTNLSTIGWPGSPIVGSTEGNGAALLLQPSNPAPGASLQITVPTNTRWQVQSAKMDVTTDNTAAPRFPRLAAVSPLPRTIWRVGNPPSILNTSAKMYVWAQGLTQFADGATIATTIAPLPSTTFLPADNNLLLELDNTQAGDQIANVAVIVQEWLVV